MLPGFRFLSAAILLSVSILVFCLGAAELLRATHEQFVSNPSWRTGPQEQVFAQAPESPQPPVLAALRVEPEAPVSATLPQDQTPTSGLPASGSEQGAAVNSDDVAPKNAAKIEASGTGEPASSAPPLDMRSAETQANEPASPDATASAKVEITSPPPGSDQTTAFLSEGPPAAANVPSPAPTPTKPADKPADLQPAEPQQAGAAPVSGIDQGTTATATVNDDQAAAGKEPGAKATPESGAPDIKAKKGRARPKKRVAHRAPAQKQPDQQFFLPFGAGN